MSNYEQEKDPFDESKSDKRPSRNSKWNLYKNSIRFINQSKVSKSQDKLDDVPGRTKDRRRSGSLGDVSKLNLEASKEK